MENKMKGKYEEEIIKRRNKRNKRWKYTYG